MQKLKGWASLYFFALKKGEGDVQRAEGEANGNGAIKAVF